MIAWRYVDDTVPKIQRGFFCGDQSISFPFKKSTVRGIWLHINFYGIPLVIWIFELLSTQSSSLRKRFIKSSSLALKWFSFYFFTFISLIILMATVKNLSGVHRPFFLDLCKPDLAENCTQGTFINSNFTCTNKNVSAYLLSESTRSFPSGHVVSVVYACLFFMWYIQMRFNKNLLLITFVHLICLLWMAVCCVTRITDNWHHVSDVIGAILITIPFVIYSVSELLKKYPHSFRFKFLFHSQCVVLCRNFDDHHRRIKHGKSDTELNLNNI